MALNPQILNHMAEILTSDRITYKGNEVMRIYEILIALRTEQQGMMMQQRVVPKPETMGMIKEAGPPPLQPMKRHPDEED